MVKSNVPLERTVKAYTQLTYVIRDENVETVPMKTDTWYRSTNDLNILDSDIENITNNIKQALLSSADKVFGKERRKNQLWVTTKIMNLCDKRRENGLDKPEL
ncbi:hypothetical protein DPMN_159066 [Dreissena polymorpha]|uniref:Uncharacterized protein n=1 Tax=Dreissena polymorpha TaxID=45954 RepID=A0A9D4EK33_DREPO|nr:hypothetical protein DPMN_159066 [Dreissena polymorpha]